MYEAKGEMVEVISMLYSFIGSIFMGSYPVLIKAPDILEARVHPIVFQCYKTFWVFMTGWLFILYRLICGYDLVYEFSLWGVVSAALWVPAGLGTIISVTKIGVGPAVVINAGTAALLSFLVFWLVFGEHMKEYGPPGGHFYLAPAWMTCVVLGLVGLVYAPQVRFPCDRQQRRQVAIKNPRGGSSGRQDLAEEPFAAAVDEPPLEDDIVMEPRQMGPKQSLGEYFIGVLASIVAGICSASQYGAFNAGKDYELEKAGCKGDFSKCSAELQEQFNNFGSWMTSFGIGSAIITVFLVLALRISSALHSAQMPSFHFKLLRVPGSIAGLCWCVGAFFQTAAVARGGNATMMPCNLAIQIICSGAWGIFFYREARGWHAVAWSAMAVVTLVSMVLLNNEKVSSG